MRYPPQQLWVAPRPLTTRIKSPGTLPAKRFRGGHVFKAHRLVYHSTLGWRVIKKKKKAASNRLFQFLALYQRSPESGDLWFKSRPLKTTICHPPLRAGYSDEERCSRCARCLPVQGLGFRVWGLGLRVWGLGFGVWA